ncbi:hypothetical protein EVAR_47521_1 [Eumeta japonica]|uniref:Uncharacterized protein n=1 Tax=Eumeta variegata TaxID=151549 RepID=A0A4C1XQ89_EUMVA|nr:hypothetical protein EVAR_47521_1 [Eumeta japonica]
MRFESLAPTRFTQIGRSIALFPPREPSSRFDWFHLIPRPRPTPLAAPTAPATQFSGRARSKDDRRTRYSGVVVMGSSTASDKTINTSTDSAATALTSITGTDDSMDADPDPEPPAPVPTTSPPTVPSTAPPHYHRARPSLELDSPPHTKHPQSATAAPTRFVFDVPMPAPTVPPAAPPAPHPDPPKSPKTALYKYETHFNFEPLMSPPPVTTTTRHESVVRRGSEPRMKHKESKHPEHYKDDVCKLRHQLENTDVFGPSSGGASSGNISMARRRSSAHQHSVPPPSRRTSGAQVRVTANPLEGAGGSIPPARTTIVVQQPSLSLDYGGCATLLLREGEESGAGGRRRSRAAVDHFQQLLDVTTNFTSEDLYEFDKKIIEEFLEFDEHLLQRYYSHDNCFRCSSGHEPRVHIRIFYIHTSADSATYSNLLEAER